MRARRIDLTWLATLSLALVMALPPAGVASAADEVKEGEVRAAYIYNFTKFVEWPSETWTNPEFPFVIGVLGSKQTVDDLTAVLQGRSIKGHPVTIKRLSDLAEIRACQLVLMEGADEAGWSALFRATEGTPILTIGDGASFARAGGMFGLFIEDHRLRFAVNQASIIRSRLQVSSKLLAMAVLVKETRRP